MDEFTTESGKSVKIHALTHASIWIEAGEVQIYVDPVTKLGDKVIDYSQMPKADYILITHGHYDHLDKTAIRKLSDGNTRPFMNKASVTSYGKATGMVNGEDKSLISYNVGRQSGENVGTYTITPSGDDKQGN